MLKFLTLLLLTQGLVFAGNREDVSAYLNKLSSENDLITRMDMFSKGLVGLPYGTFGPLGEGEIGRYDQDPLYRLDTFDCTTFVETVISLSLSREINEFEEHMNQIRYQNGEIDFLKRNHFPSLQWIPYNEENGLLVEINDLIVPVQSQKVAEAVINLPGWLKHIKIEEIRVPDASLEERQNLLEELHQLASSYSPVVAKLKYIPISTLLETPSLLNKIPSGSIINFVRPNWDLTETAGTHMNVSHQGFIFRKGKEIILRHASSSKDMKVIESNLFEYLKKFENHPTLKGIHLMQVNAN
ncbi:MAG: N-acetylmuramoyl-L-alanine amidase-like domain-containing protein [Bacteriovoracaceae bacterium]